MLSKNHITHGQRELTLIIQYLMPHFSNFKNQYTLNSTAICYLWQVPFSSNGFKYKQSGRETVDLATLVANSFERHSSKKMLLSLQASGLRLTVTSRQRAVINHMCVLCQIGAYHKLEMCPGQQGRGVISIVGGWLL